MFVGRDMTLDNALSCDMSRPCTQIPGRFPEQGIVSPRALAALVPLLIFVQSR